MNRGMIRRVLGRGMAQGIRPWQGTVTGNGPRRRIAQFVDPEAEVAGFDAGDEGITE